MPQPNQNPSQGQADTRERRSTSQPGRDRDDQREMLDQDIDIDKEFGENTEQQGASSSMNPTAQGSQKRRGEQSREGVNNNIKDEDEGD
jgi:hypothetical protein